MLVLLLILLAASCKSTDRAKPPEAQHQSVAATDYLPAEGESVRAVSSQNGHCNAEAVMQNAVEVLTLACDNTLVLTLRASIPIMLSPNGAQLLYVHAETGAATAVYLYDRTSSTVTQLSNVGISANTKGTRPPDGWVPIPEDYDGVTWSNGIVSYTTGLSHVSLHVPFEGSP
jgi:hypothetical protein